MMGSRSRTVSESSDAGEQQTGGRPMSPMMSLPAKLIGYDLEGKFTYNQVLKANIARQNKSTVDENGKFEYVSADMRPVPPGWYDLDKSKQRVPQGWYDPTTKTK
eukprot:TRINITY_DN56922_c0_g1_i1.p1 TRINITY_DN56922_c0_g1~~TRINITY_DN56922_c0_g1_i1.p1  ORF type:complete len:105 (+),score=13.82 TRINITY_DN56922_c0_g1_i1:114-428(+)